MFHPAVQLDDDSMILIEYEFHTDEHVRGFGNRPDGGMINTWVLSNLDPQNQH